VQVAADEHGRKRTGRPVEQRRSRDVRPEPVTGNSAPRAAASWLGCRNSRLAIIAAASAAEPAVDIIH
jgi:hypothetical protein